MHRTRNEASTVTLLPSLSRFVCNFSPLNQRTHPRCPATYLLILICRVPIRVPIFQIAGEQVEPYPQHCPCRPNAILPSSMLALTDNQLFRRDGGRQRLDAGEAQRIPRTCRRPVKVAWSSLHRRRSRRRDTGRTDGINPIGSIGNALA